MYRRSSSGDLAPFLYICTMEGWRDIQYINVHRSSSSMDLDGYIDGERTTMSTYMYSCVARII